MSAAHHGALGVPRFHLRSPHVEWHRVEHPIRAALLTAAALLTVAVGAVSARELPALLATPDTAPPSALEQPELPREWRYERRAVAYEHTYGRHAQAPSVEPMYMKPRPQR
jgi:hypothetical protein